MAVTGCRCCPDHRADIAGVSACGAWGIRVGRRLVDDRHPWIIGGGQRFVFDVVAAHSTAAVLSAHGHDVLD